MWNVAVKRGPALGLWGMLTLAACGETRQSNEPGRGGSGASGATDAVSGNGGASAGSGLAGAGGDAGGSASSAGTAGSAGSIDCVGLECDVPNCPAGATTRITGKVFDPSGTLPLYNAVVFVPNGDAPAFTPGPSCDLCGSNAGPIVVAATTDETGSFVLEGAPAGANIPLVIQIGRWRRQVTLPSVEPCVEATVTAEQTRLPKNQAEGDIPLIAIAAGGGDQLECLPRRLGIDDAEFTTAAGNGRIHLYSGGDPGQELLSPTQFAPTLNDGAQLPEATTLWADLASLQRYDMVWLSCEGSALEIEKPLAARQAMYDYASTGGRVFASHWQRVWFTDGAPALLTTGTWQDRQDPTENGAPLSATVNQTFPKGAAFASWLVGIGASDMLGSLTVTFPRDNLQAVDPMLAREWLTVQSPRYPAMAPSVQYMSATTPIGVPATEACGRAAYTGLHVADTTLDPNPSGELRFPLYCEDRAMNNQEKAIAFLLFDLSSCIAPADLP